MYNKLYEDKSVANIYIKYFDKEYYLSSYLDVEKTNIDPVKHYNTCGWKEGRNPSPNFSTAGYLNKHPDTLAYRINPLLHSIVKSGKISRILLVKSYILNIASSLGLFIYSVILYIIGKRVRAKKYRDMATQRISQFEIQKNGGGAPLSRLFSGIWWERNGRLSSAQQQEIVRRIDDWGDDCPKISIVMAVYNTSPDFLDAAIKSVRSQLYTNWELCIADDASDNPVIAEILNREFATDGRIKVCFRESNGGIAAATNTSLALASGEYIAFMDHDDALTPYALFYIAETVRDRDIDLVYSDEALIDHDGNVIDIHFKSEWNEELLLSQNYVNHLCAFKSEKLSEINGVRDGFEGSQDHDLLLRFFLTSSEDKIVRIPKVLYLWRVYSGYVTFSERGKESVLSARRAAVVDYIKQKNTGTASVETGPSNFNRIVWHLEEPNPLVSIIVPTRDQKHLLEICIKSLLENTDYPNKEIIVVNNRSSETETREYLGEIGKHETISVIDFDEEFNFSRINNHAVKHAKGQYIALLNNDTEAKDAGWLTEMMRYACRPEIGAVGAKLLYSDETIQHAGVICGIGGVAGHSHKHVANADEGYFWRMHLAQYITAVTGACLVVDKFKYLEVGGLDEENLKVAFNDIDLCLSLIKAGYKNVYTPNAVLYHHESKTRGFDTSGEKLNRFLSEVYFMKNKWGESLERDQYYNPNLSDKLENFSFK